MKSNFLYAMLVVFVLGLSGLSSCKEDDDDGLGNNNNNTNTNTNNNNNNTNNNNNNNNTNNNNNNNSDCNVYWSNALQDEATAMTNAATAYGNNPNSSTCNAYKNAVQDYIDEAQDLLDTCPNLTGQDRQDVEDALDQAESSLSSFNC